MGDISGTGKKRTTKDEALVPDLKEDHENRPHSTDDSRDPINKRGHAQSFWQRFKAGTIQNQLTVIFTGLIFIATGVYAGFSGWQLSVMKQQLKEIHGSSADTHDLAIAAGKQADAAKKQSQQAEAQTRAMGDSLTKTDNLIKATNRLVTAAKRSADAANNANEIASRALMQSERANVAVGRPDGVVAEFVMPNDPKAKAGIVVYFQNTGRMPARFNWGSDSPLIAMLPEDPNAVKEPYGTDGLKLIPTTFFSR